MTRDPKSPPPGGPLTTTSDATTRPRRRIVADVLVGAALVAGALALIAGVAIGLDEPDEAWAGPARLYDALMALAW